MSGRPIVIAYHLIFTAYGWWLPNDPRGSSSHQIRCDHISLLGELHHGRKRVQPTGREIRAFYQQARTHLSHDLLVFTEPQRDEIARAFASVVHDQRYTCWACAIMPDHVHLVMRRHKHDAEHMIANLQSRSREHLVQQPFAHRSPDHPVWGGPGWVVYLDHPDEVQRTITYVHDNPRKGGLPSQSFPELVQSYDRWPLHPGHSERSPYVTRLRAAGRYP